MEQLFVFGTLKQPDVQKEVIGRTIEGLSDTLEGYKIATVDIEGETYPNIKESPGRVDGLVLEVSPEELGKIDEYETEAYQRKRVVLKSGKETWVYQAPSRQ